MVAGLRRRGLCAQDGYYPNVSSGMATRGTTNVLAGGTCTVSSGSGIGTYYPAPDVNAAAFSGGDALHTRAFF